MVLLVLMALLVLMVLAALLALTVLMAPTVLMDPPLLSNRKAPKTVDVSQTIFLSRKTRMGFPIRFMILTARTLWNLRILKF